LRRWLAVLFPVALLAVAPLLVHHLPAWTEQVHQLGPWGPLAYAVLYAVAMLAGLPCLALALGAGALFGAGPGLAAVYGGEVLGSVGCYAAGRWLGGEAVRDWVANHPRLSWLEPLLQKEGGLVVGLSHLVPFLPFNLINYGCGLMGLPFGSFLFWTALGVLPWNAVAVLGADMLVEARRGGPLRPELLALAGGLLVLIAVLLVYARRRLKRSTG
jgi:uncharacterized membrane protein YdjX (TVP38/TMEM64 family)